MSRWDVIEFGEDEKRLTQSYISPIVPFRCGFWMLWECTHFEARTELVTLPPPTLNDQRYVLRNLTRACCPMIAITIIIVHSCWPKFRVAAKKRFHHHNRVDYKRSRFESHTGHNQETCLNQKRLHY